MGKDAINNFLMVAPKVQKDISQGFAHVIVQFMLKEIENNVFCVLLDESIDVLQITYSCGLAVS